MTLDLTFTLLPTERQGLRRALQDGFALYVQRRGQIPSPARLCFAVLQDALDTFRKQPDKERGWLRGPRTAWPESQAGPGSHTESEKEFALYFSETSLLRTSTRATPREVSDMEAVLTAFPRALEGDQTVRDWRIMWRLATKYGEGRKLAVEYGISKQAVYQIRDRQLDALGRRLRNLMPDDVACYARAAA
jgi:hypothetical protein